MSKSKDKGTREETAVVTFLNDHGIRARRMALSGAKDKGDVELLDFPIIIEVKNRARVNLNEYVDEANGEAVNAGAAIGVAWHKRIRKGSPGDHFVTMDGYTFLKLLDRIKSPSPDILLEEK